MTEYLLIRFPGRVPSMKNSRELRLKGKIPIMAHSKGMLDYVNNNRHYLYRQFVKFVNEGGCRVPSPNTVAVYLLINGHKEGIGLPTYDDDGILTSVLEMMQPREVSKVGILGCIDNDRQIRSHKVESNFVASRDHESSVAVVWGYNTARPTQEQYVEAERLAFAYKTSEDSVLYGELEDFLKEIK